jgi:hypothetical protein
MSISLSKWPMLPTIALFFILDMSCCVVAQSPRQQTTTRVSARASRKRGAPPAAHAAHRPSLRPDASPPRFRRRARIT